MGAYPYDVKLTELDRFKPSQYEIELATHPSFLALQAAGWPFDWGEHITGKRFVANRANNGHPNAERAKDLAIVAAFEPTGSVALLPAQVGTQFDAFAQHFRSMLIVLSKLERDAKAEPDKILLSDLQIWLRGKEFAKRGFRWERHYEELMREQKQAAWVRRVEELRQGESHVVAILRDRLNDSEMEEVRTILEREKFGFISSGGHPKEHFPRKLHFPYMRCLSCATSIVDAVSHKSCNRQHVVLVIDSGLGKDVLGYLPRRLRKNLQMAEFTVPRWTFNGPEIAGECEDIFARLFVVSMEQASRTHQQQIYARVMAWANDINRKDEAWRVEQQYETAGKGLQSFVVLKPEGSKSINALAIAGPRANASYWSDLPFRGDRLADVLYGLMGQVSTIH